MSDLVKDNNDFVFIKEQVRPQKRKILNKFVFPLLTMVLMAIVFGLVAAVTFCLAEPRFYKLINKEETESGNIFARTDTGNGFKNGNSEDNHEMGYNYANKNQGYDKQNDNDDGGKNKDENADDNNNSIANEPNPVIVETVNADINDYVSIYNELKNLSYEVEKSILKVSSIIQGKDWFGNPTEKEINTTGVVLENSDNQLKLLVSLDRVKDASSIKIEINDNVSVDAELEDYETELNLAVIAVNITDIPVKLYGNITVAKMGESYPLTVGSPVIALGNPNGYSSSIDIGIITSEGNTVSITDNELDIFYTNMAFNNESDGIIVNLKGEIIGLITRTLKSENDEDLSTIVGISKIKPYINKMLTRTSRICCGVIAENLPQAAMAEYDVDNGVYVYEVIKDSPAFKAGLKSGDIILNVGDRNIYNMSSFYNTISEYEPGTEVPFKIKRTSGSSDKELEINVTLNAKEQ